MPYYVNKVAFKYEDRNTNSL